MATIVVTNASAVVNSVDLSDHLKKVVITRSADMNEDTAMGSGYHTMKPGGLKFKCALEFYQDFAGSKSDATVGALVGVAPFPLVVKGNASAGTNNTFTMANVVLDGDYNPLDASWGQLDVFTVNFVPGSGFTYAQT